MADYDYKNIKRFIQMHSDLIDHVELGMAEDWAWTLKTVYENGRFLLNLDEKPPIAGIQGSSWATPVMDVSYKDGCQETKNAFVGEVTPENRPIWFSLGGISQEIQDVRDSKFLN